MTMSFPHTSQTIPRPASCPRDRLRPLLLAALLLASGRTGFAAASESEFSSAEYVTVVDGHLTRRGERLRLWGVNVQTGFFKSYEEIDRLITRLKALGFNAIRLWPTAATFYAATSGSDVKAVDSKRGDGSELDRFDYFVARAAEEQMSIQMTILYTIGVPMMRSLKGSPVARLVESAPNNASLRALLGFAPYVSPDYRDFLKAHMEHVLKRVNPYTRRRYADEPAISAWELGNEARFVECALSQACLERLPASVLSDLSARWAESPLNESHEPLPANLSALFTPGGYPPYSRFVATTFLSVSEELRRHAREAGGPGSGVAVQPFIFNTGPVTPSALAHYCYSQGDVLSTAFYHSPLKKTDGFKGTPWQPVSAGGALSSTLANMKVHRKPLVIYETSFFRPFPFRVEWGPMMAAIALQQDWDGAFLYHYGQPRAIYTDEGRPSGYGTKPLPEPVAREFGGAGSYDVGFQHGSDPAAISSWSVASRLVRAVSESPPVRTLWQIPTEDLFKSAQGYPPDLWRQAAESARSGSVAIEFTADAKSQCSPCQFDTTAPKSFKVQWPSGDGDAMLVVKTPAGTAITGQFQQGELDEMKAELNATVTEPGFGLVAVLKDDAATGKLASSPQTLVVMGDVNNTSRDFDGSRVDFTTPAGALRGMKRRGDLPLVYEGPTVDFRTPRGVRFLEDNFGLEGTERSVRPPYRYAGTSGIFRVRLVQVPKQARFDK